MTLFLYTLRLLVTAVTVAVAGIAFVVFPAITVSAVHKLGGVSVQAILGFLPLIAVELVPYLVPMGFLLAVVSTFGRLAADNEWTAIAMAGVHPTRMLAPAVLLAVVFSIGTGWLLSTVSPEWKFLQRTYKRHAIQRAVESLYPGRTTIKVGEFFLDAARRDGNTFYQVLVVVPASEESKGAKLVADSATCTMDGDLLKIDFFRPRVVKGELDFSVGGSISLVRDLDDLVPVSDKDRSEPKYRTSEDLSRAVESGEVTAEERREYRYEVHHRWALATTYFLFLFLGVPTGLWLRRGTQLAAFAVAVGYALVYFVLSLRLGKELSAVGALPAVACAWATNGIGLVVGLVLTKRILWR